MQVMSLSVHSLIFENVIESYRIEQSALLPNDDNDDDSRLSWLDE